MAIGGSGKGIQIIVGTDYKDKDLKRAQNDLNRLQKNAVATQGPMQRLGSTIRNNLGPALLMAGAAAAAFAIKLGVDGVKAAIADQKTVEVLAQTLENLGQAHRKAGVEQFVAALESATGVADEELRPALGLLAVATGDVDEAQRRLQQAMDVSIGTGQSLTTVVKAFQRALATGTAGSLSRYGIILDQNILATQGFEAALDKAAGAFRGLTQREAATLEGQLRILATEFDNLKEAFGYGFLGGVSESTDGMSDMAAAMRELRPVFELLGEQIGGAIRSLGEMSGSLQTLGEDLNVPRSEGAANFLSYFLGLPGLLKSGANALGLFADESLTMAEAHADYRDAAVRATTATVDAIAPTEEMAAALEAEAEAAEKAAAEFDKLSAAIANTGIVTSYQAAFDDLRKTVKDTGGETSVFNDKGRETVDAYVDLAKNAGAYIETLDSKAKRIQTATGLLDTLQSSLGKTKMDPATQAALLDPFQALINDLYESGVDTDLLQAKLDKLKSKTIDITVVTTTVGGRPPGVSDEEWYGAVGGKVPKFYGAGGSARGMDTIPAMLAPGEFVVRRQAVKKFGADLFSQLNSGINPLAGMQPQRGGSGSGVSIGTINVNSAAGERADQSLPRALRRMAFLAGA
jgi:hypothetical protein